MFTNIDQIKQKFGIAETGLPEIKKELRKITALLHPDKNGKTEFESETDKETFLSAVSAIEFIDSMENRDNFVSTAIIPLPVNTLIEIIRDIIPAKENEKKASVEERLQDQITQRSIEIKSHNRYPKLTVSAISVLLTVLWAFPSTVSEHPILSKYIDIATPAFGFLWLLSVILTAVIWYLSKVVETQQKIFQSRLRTEIFQNNIFTDFLWKRLDLRSLEKLRLKMRQFRHADKKSRINQLELDALTDEIEHNLNLHKNGDVLAFARQVNSVLQRAKKTLNITIPSPTTER